MKKQKRKEEKRPKRLQKLVYSWITNLDFDALHLLEQKAQCPLYQLLDQRGYEMVLQLDEHQIEAFYKAFPEVIKSIPFSMVFAVNRSVPGGIKVLEINQNQYFEEDWECVVTQSLLQDRSYLDINDCIIKESEEKTFDSYVECLIWIKKKMGWLPKIQYLTLFLNKVETRLIYKHQTPFPSLKKLREITGIKKVTFPMDAVHCIEDIEEWKLQNYETILLKCDDLKWTLSNRYKLRNLFQFIKIMGEEKIVIKNEAFVKEMINQYEVFEYDEELQENFLSLCNKLGQIEECRKQLRALLQGKPMNSYRFFFKELFESERPLEPIEEE